MDDERWKMDLSQLGIRNEELGIESLNSQPSTLNPKLSTVNS